MTFKLESSLTDHVQDERLVGELDQWFGPRQRQRTESCTKTADQNQGLHVHQVLSW